jgi:site-specific DNA recombinase
MTLLCRVEINPDRIEINVSRGRLAALLSGQAIDLRTQDQRTDRDSDDVVMLAAPARLKRVGREMRMLIENSDDQTAADPSLLRIITRAQDVQTRLIRNTKLTAHDIARAGNPRRAHLRRSRQPDDTDPHEQERRAIPLLCVSRAPAEARK